MSPKSLLRGCFLMLSTVLALVWSPPCLGQGLPELAIKPERVIEPDTGTRSVVMTVYLNPVVTTGTVTVNWATIDGTALAGQDYQPASGTLSFASGERQKNITVNVIGDTVVERDEEFRVTLTGAAGAALAAPAARILIRDNETPPYLLQPENVIVPERLSSGAVGTMTLIPTIDLPGASVGISLKSGTAEAGVDFSSSVSSVPFQEGLPVVVEINGIDDALSEADETFWIKLAAPEGMETVGLTLAETRSQDPPYAAAVAMDAGIAAKAGEWLSIYRLGTDGWALEANLERPADVLLSNPVDHGVAVDQGLVAISQPEEGVWIYEKAGTTWSVTGRVPPPSLLTGFGAAVALGDGVLAVGAVVPGYPDIDPPGEVRLYERHWSGNGQWVLRQVISAPAGAQSFGAVISMWGNHLAVAAPEQDIVTMFLRNPQTGLWAQSGTLGRENSLWRFGHSLALDGDALVIGAPPDLYVGASYGQAYFSFNTKPEGAAWQPYALLPGPPGGPLMGTCLALDRNHLMVGDPKSAEGVFYYRDGARWRRHGVLNAGAGTGGGETLGCVAAMRGGWLFLNEKTLPAFGLPPQPLRIYQTGLVPGMVLDDESFAITALGNAGLEPSSTEGTGILNMAIRIARPVPFPVSVRYSLRNGTAQGGADFVEEGGWVEIASGDTSVLVPVVLRYDTVFEASETFELVLEEATFGTPGPPATGTILQQPPLVSISDATLTEGNGGPQERIIVVSVGGEASNGESVDWSIENGSATGGEDFTLASGTLHFLAGQTIYTLPVTVNGDAVCEPSETFLIRLSNPVNVVYGGGPPATMTILDDDTGEPAGDAYAISQGGSLTGVNVQDNDCRVVRVVAVAKPKFGSFKLEDTGRVSYTPYANFFGTDTFQYQMPAPDLVPDGATFRWFHPLTGINPATGNALFNTTWYTSAFNDSAWGTGRFLMGYGEIQGSSGHPTPFTNIGTPGSFVRYSAYFRHKFQVNAAGIYDLDLVIGRDDAAIIYINGREVARSYEPAARFFPTAPDTWAALVDAATGNTNEGLPYTHTLKGIPLESGLNTLAISLHNADSSSSDLGLRVYALSAVAADVPLPGIGPVLPVAINVADGHVPPLLQPDSYTTGEDTPITPVSTLYANDGLLDDTGSAFDPILEVETLDEKHGHVTNLNQLTGAFTFTPEAEYWGAGSFKYRVRDKDGWSLPAKVVITVNADLVLSPFVRTGPAAGFLSISRTPGVTLAAGRPADAVLDLKAGQTISVRASASTGVLERVTLSGPDRVPLPGANSVTGEFQHFVVPATQTYFLTLTGATDGGGNVTVLVNGDLPQQVLPSSAPHDLGPAQAPGLAGPAGVRSAVVNRMLPTGALSQVYSWSGTAGNEVSVILLSSSGGAGTFLIQDAAGGVLAQSAPNLGIPGASEKSVVLPADGFWRIVVLPKDGMEYSLHLYQNGVRHDGGPSSALLVEAASGGLSGPGVVDTVATFANFGDYGADSPEEGRVAAMVKSWNPDFIIANGDHNYSSDYTVGSPSWTARVGNYYGDFIQGRVDERYPEQRSPRQRFYPVPGNHDSGPDSYNGGELSGYFDYFLANPGGVQRLPEGIHQPMLSYYKLRRGNCEFYLIDSDNATVSTAANTEQRNWLKQQLATSTARWKFLAMHHPPYSSAMHGDEPLMQWGADWQGLTAIFTGHDHTYERLDAGNGVVQFVSGLGGQIKYSFYSPRTQSRFRYNQYHGAMRVKAGADSVKFEFLSINDGANGANGGALIDTYTVTTPAAPTTNTGVDVWKMAVKPHETITLATSTPQPPGGLTNLIQPGLEVRDASGAVVASNTGGAADHFNAKLVVTVPGNCPAAGCEWTVRAVNQNVEEGEYLLTRSVSTPRNLYDAWSAIALPGLAPALRDPEADPDGDGLKNLVEYSAGRDPATPESTPVLGISAGPLLDLALPDAVPAGVTCTVEASPNLTADSWQVMASRTGASVWTSPSGALPLRGNDGWRLVPASSTARTLYYRLRFQLN